MISNQKGREVDTHSLHLNLRHDLVLLAGKKEDWEVGREEGQLVLGGPDF